MPPRQSERSARCAKPFRRVHHVRPTQPSEGAQQRRQKHHRTNAGSAGIPFVPDLRSGRVVTKVAGIRHAAGNASKPDAQARHETAGLADPQAGAPSGFDDSGAKVEVNPPELAAALDLFRQPPIVFRPVRVG